MKLKTVEVSGATYAVVQDGKPVFVDKDGKDVAFDVEHTVNTISRLNGEAKSHRERAEGAESKLAAFAGIEDPAKAIEAMRTVQNLSDKKLVDAGDVEKVKAEAIKAVRAEFEPVVSERDKLRTELHGEKIGGSFARSKYISDKLAIPVDLVEARFGRAFELKDGKVVAKDSNGNAIYSKARPGDLADFDEALEILVDAYPQKASILKGTGAGGGGAENKGGGGGNGKTMTRAEFAQLSPSEQIARSNDGVKVVDSAA